MQACFAETKNDVTDRIRKSLCNYFLFYLRGLKTSLLLFPLSYSLKEEGWTRTNDKQILILRKPLCKLAPASGFEPETTGSEPVVLPVTPNRYIISCDEVGFEPTLRRLTICVLPATPFIKINISYISLKDHFKLHSGLPFKNQILQNIIHINLLYSYGLSN